MAVIQSKIHLLEKEIERLKKLVYLDPLTNLYNRRGFLEISNNYFKSFTRDQKKRRHYEISNLAIIFLDLDNFKAINDRYGHALGDKVLKSLSKLLKQSLRSMDVIGRWGGEEFVILLVNISQSNAQRLAEKLRHKIESTKLARVSITASFGLVFPKKDKSLIELINQADKLMYRAKKLGKNKVICIK
ncbi:MAG: GGDEF domain-containing protein [Parcubacteria group bacterium]|nr:GGDEF domain-containing protein [Parcubacteria group bacterium]